MKEQLEKEKAELEQRILENQQKIEEIQNAIYWDKKRLATNRRQMESLTIPKASEVIQEISESLGNGKG